MPGQLRGAPCSEGTVCGRFDGIDGALAGSIGEPRSAGDRHARREPVSTACLPYAEHGGVLSTLVTSWFPDSLDYVRRPNWISFSGSVYDISDDDLRPLQEFGSLSTICIANTEVTDAGLDHLLHLKGIRQVVLTGSRVSDDGIDRMQKVFPGVHIQR